MPTDPPRTTDTLPICETRKAKRRDWDTQIQECSGDAATEDVLGALEHSHLDSLANDISVLIQNALAFQADLNNALRTVKKLQQEATPGASNAYTDASKSLQSCCDMYTKILWRAREQATTVAGPQCVSGFVNIIARALVVDPSIPHDAVVAGLKGFIRNLSSSHVAGTEEPSFGQLSKELDIARCNIEQMSDVVHPNDRGAEVDRLKRELKSAREQVRRLHLEYKLEHVPYSCAISKFATRVVLGLGSAAFALCVIYSPGAVFSIKSVVIGGPMCLMLRPSYAKIQDLIQELALAEQSLIPKPAINTTPEDRQRQALVQVTQAQQKLLGEVELALSVFGQVQSAVLKDCQAYLHFIEGPESTNSAVKEQEVRKLQAAARLYDPLPACLKGFANAVIIPRASHATVDAVPPTERIAQIAM